MKLGAFVMTFHRPEILGDTLRRLLAQSRPPDAIRVLDNGSSEETRRVVAGLEDPRLRYVDLGDNLGPAGAAAEGLRWARAEGFDWTYWGDDDDPPQSEDTLERLLDFAGTSPSPRLAGVAAVGARWSWDRGALERLRDEDLAGPVAVDAIGGNAQLLVARRALETALPRPELFWGYEEIEYCLRLRQKGLDLFVDGDLMREYRQRAGRMGLQLRKSWVSQLDREQTWRHYYRIRNYIHLMRRTFHRPGLARREASKGLARGLLAFRRGPRFGWRFGRMQVRAVLDGYRDRLGRTVSPLVS